MMEKPWTVVSKEQGLPMSRGVARITIEGIPKYFRCVSFRKDRAVRFKSKEEALFFLDGVQYKYGTARKWKPFEWKKIDKKRFWD